MCGPDWQSAQCGLVGRVCCVCVCVPDRRSAQCSLVGRVHAYVSLTGGLLGLVGRVV